MNSTSMRRSGAPIEADAQTNLFAILVAAFAIGGVVGGVIAGWWAEFFGRLVASVRRLRFDSLSFCLSLTVYLSFLFLFSLPLCVCVCVCLCHPDSVVVERLLMVRWVIGSILHGGPIELFLIPVSAPQLV